MSNKSFLPTGPSRIETGQPFVPVQRVQGQRSQSKPVVQHTTPQATVAAPAMIDAKVFKEVETAASIPALNVGNGREDHTQRDTKGQILGSEWERIELPSNFVFYEWPDISVKRFEPIDHAKLARGIRNTNISIVLDVLSSTCNRDVRELVYSDFQALCIWHKLNSYLNTPYTIQWMSKYGVRGNAQVEKTAVREISLKKTRIEYLEYKKKGLTSSTSKDMEILSGGSFDEDTIFLFEKAQFIDLAPLAWRIEELTALGDRAPSVTARIEKLNSLGLKFYPIIDEFNEQFNEFGFQEYAHVKLAKDLFDPVKAIESLRSPERLELLKEEQRVHDLHEADKIALEIAEGKESHPTREEVPLAFNLWSMFPYI